MQVPQLLVLEGFLTRDHIDKSRDHYFTYRYQTYRKYLIYLFSSLNLHNLLDTFSNISSNE